MAGTRAKWEGRQVALLMLIAAVFMGVVQFPKCLQWFTDLNQREWLMGYIDSVEQVDEDIRREINAAATDYNEELYLGHMRLTSATEDERYQSLVKIPGTDLMARISLPRLNIYMPVMAGTTDEVLKRAAGHLYGTSLPVGGRSTHAVVTAHSGMVSAHMFTNLDQAVIGDMMVVNVLGETLWYQVYDIEKILPDELDDLVIHRGKDLLTFITCTPVGINTHRLLVMGERVPAPHDESEVINMTMWAYPGVPWWAIWESGSIAASGLVGRFLLVPHWRRIRAKSLDNAPSSSVQGLRVEPAMTACEAPSSCELPDPHPTTVIPARGACDTAWNLTPLPSRRSLRMAAAAAELEGGVA